MRRWTDIVLLIFALALPAAGRAEEITFTASVDRETISITDRLTYTLTIEGTRISSVEDLPSIPGFQFYSRSGPNYRLDPKTQRTITEFNYTLIPLTLGRFTIPTIPFVIGGKTYYTSRIMVNVVDGPIPTLPPAELAPGSAWPANTTPGTSPLIYISTDVDKEQAYVNEQVTLKFKLYIRNSNVADVQYSSPRPIGFTEERLGEQQTYEEYRFEHLYSVIEFSKAIFPTIAGKISIGKAEFRGYILGSDRSRQPFVVSSSPISLTIHSLPQEGRPLNYRGAVGEFDFGVYYWPTEIRLREPITVTMQISGRGNLDTIVVPDIPVGKSFQVGAPEIATQKNVENGRIGGKKIFKQVLLPLSTNIQEWPKIDFSYFDPGLQEYRQISVAPTPQIFIKTEVDRKEPYVNEQIQLKFKLYSTDIQFDNYETSQRSTTGFIEEKIGGEKKYTEEQDGLRYNVHELSSAIFPISAGDLTIGPAELKGDILVPQQRRRMRTFGFNDPFFDDFFRGAFAERRPFALRSEPITLTVKPLPREGRPEDFRGAVGQFELEASAAPEKVRAGDPVTVTMMISGRGNLDSVAVPEIPAGDEFQTYAPEVETRKDVRNGRIGGEKIFKQVLIPLTAEVEELPSVSFSFFDPERGEYRTLSRPPMAIEVEAAPDRETLRLVEEARGRAGGEEIRLLSRDILHIKSDPGRLSPRGYPYYRRPLFWGGALALPLILLAAWGVVARKERLEGDIVYARQVGASRSARRRFKEARRLLAAGEGQRFYGEVHRAFNRYLGDKFLLPAGAVSPELIAGKITAGGADPAIADEVGECLAAFDRARFSGAAAGEAEMRSFLARVENLVGTLEKIKIK